MKCSGPPPAAATKSSAPSHAGSPSCACPGSPSPAGLPASPHRWHSNWQRGAAADSPPGRSRQLPRGALTRRQRPRRRVRSDRFQIGFHLGCWRGRQGGYQSGLFCRAIGNNCGSLVNHFRGVVQLRDGTDQEKRCNDHLPPQCCLWVLQIRLKRDSLRHVFLSVREICRAMFPGQMNLTPRTPCEGNARVISQGRLRMWKREWYPASS